MFVSIKNKFKKREGFTLIEMLVVVAIIAMILSITLSVYGESKQKGRDSRREADMKEIRNALNIYAVQNGYFPACGSLTDLGNPDSNTYVKIDGSGDCLSQELVAGQFMSRVPDDPLNGGVGTCGGAGSYVYCYVSDGISYILRYALETDNISGKSAGWQIIVIE